jgi:inosine-uridine nucleoside N-ribohydrolase
MQRIIIDADAGVDDALALLYVLTRAMSLDVETKGEATRGLIVAGQRAWKHPAPNAEVSTTAEQGAVRW